ncbi:bifunctional protein-serine/threonine kinase/phosphatase [Methylovirgula ligni]|uniref:bifunctional protein-serine/threonine kinase/phosphatase n=1 Tax=Methylovirgula ligni TaxID=569860 RepID=UPI001A914D3B|nr:bifunctional protein-serine/threonine kinase/phosphatase [Methylovirgula ligni]
MSARGQLEIAAGFATRAGKRTNNQDFGTVDIGTASQRAVQGIVAAVADGFGNAQGGRVASELAVRAFIDGYRSQREPVGVGAAAMKSLDAYNLWLHGQSRSDPVLRGASTTFTAAVLLGRIATILHVGDSRAWHLRAGNLTLLTDDHSAPQAHGGRALLRAAGLEPALRLDIKTQSLEAQDRLLLTTRGVHEFLSANNLLQLLARREEVAQTDADAIVDAAIAAGSDDDTTALVIDIITVPSPAYSSVVAGMEALPIRPIPALGETIDGFKLVRILAESKTGRLFLAKRDDEWAVLKLPDPATTTPIERTRFMREVFLGQRIAHPNVGASLLLPEGRQSRLYVAMPYYKGETLEDRLRRDGPMKVDEAVAIAIKAARGLAALHKASVTHRDIKPGNIMLLENGDVKLIDLGVAHLPRLEDVDEVETPGTLDYMAPELFRENRGDALSDQYALGVTLYRMLSGKYPFGETPPGERPLFGPVPPLSAYRDDIPAWLNAVILRTISLRRDDRFGDLDEFIFALEHGNLRPAPLHRGPLIERNPLLFWQVLCAVLIILLVLSIVRR